MKREVSHEELVALVKAARRGDRAAFGRLVEATMPMVHRVIRRLVDSRIQVEDLVQEAYVKAWKGLVRLESPEAFRGWLVRIAASVAVDEGRRRRRRPATVPMALEIADPDSSSRMDKRIDAEAVRSAMRKALGSMSERLAEVMTLYLEGFSVKEIAKVLSLSPGTVKSRLYYARKRLSACLRKELGR